MGFDTPAGEGFQNQHVIPQELKDHPVLKTLSEAGLFDIDDVNLNRLRLPTKSTSAAAEELSLGLETTHQGPHAAYTRFS